MQLYNMVGYKLYKEDENGNSHMLRITRMKKPFKIDTNTKDPAEINVYDYETESIKKVRVDSLKDYSPIKPDGIFTISIVHIRDAKGQVYRDVIATAAKYLLVELGIDNTPYVVCRQNINDIFYSLMSSDPETDNLVGLSVSKDTCPSNFDFKLMLAADSVECSDIVNFYRTDNIDDILKLFNIKKYNDVLLDSFQTYIKRIKKPEYNFKKECGGWCRDLETLLKINNFESDINQMLDITKVEFNISNFVEEKDMPGKPGYKYTIANDDFKTWLSITFKHNISEAGILVYDHDINLGDFKNNNHLLIKDITGTLYLIVFTSYGEFLEEDLKTKAAELDFSTKFKIDFYNKYNKINI